MSLIPNLLLNGALRADVASLFVVADAFRAFTSYKTEPRGGGNAACPANEPMQKPSSERRGKDKR